VQDVEAEEKAVRAGFISRAHVVKGRGYDVEEIDRERQLDNERDRKLGLVSTSDASATDSSGKPRMEPDDAMAGTEAA
jgi:capsid protein